MHRQNNFSENGFEAWGGYMNAKIAKLEDQFFKSTVKEGNGISKIFTGVSIFVNGFTTPSADELKKLMSQHGGIYHTYQRNNDFIIASNLPDTKIKRMCLDKVVRPEWIIESIAAKRLLDHREYLLYKNTQTQPALNFNRMIEDKSDENISNNGNNKNNVLVNNICETHIKTAVDPQFLAEFYNNSRLHHISQLGAYFKQLINNLREESNFIFPARLKLKDKILSVNNATSLSPIIFEKGKTIMHIDMDCFFVSVGLRKRKHLRGLPVAVTHSKGGQPRTVRAGVERDTEFSLYNQKQVEKIAKTVGVVEKEYESRVDNIGDEDTEFGSMSEIASCSYEARAKGVKNGMFMGAALKLCPSLKTIPYDFEEYKEVANTLYYTIAQYTLDIEAVSCDEMYVDCTELLNDMNVGVQDFATVIREEIKMKTGCPCSAGFGGNRLQARLATKKAKPDGQFFLTAELVGDFMHDIKLIDLPGVGKQTAIKLESIGHHTCGSLQNLSLSTLKTHLGAKTGSQLFDQCRGRDENQLHFYTVRKSVSAEVNYGIRFENNNQCFEFLKQLSLEVHNRMVQFKVIGKCVTLKLMIRAEAAPIETAKFLGHGFCDVITKSVLLNAATNSADIISKEVINIYVKQKLDAKKMRGVGIQVSKLENSSKISTGGISKFLCKTSKQTFADNFMSKKSTHLDEHNMWKIDKQPNDFLKSSSKKYTSTVKFDNVGLIKSPQKKRGRPKSGTSATILVKSKRNHNFFHVTNVKEIACLNITPKLKIPSETVVKEVGKQQGLLALPWNKVRELLRAWLENNQTPLQCDIDLITDYLCEMVINKNIDKLKILLNFLRRRSHEIGNENNWINVCNNIIEQVQNTMIAVYGKQLFISV